MQFTIRNQDYSLSILLKGNKLESIEDLQLYELFWTLFMLISNPIYKITKILPKLISSIFVILKLFLWEL